MKEFMYICTTQDIAVAFNNALQIRGDSYLCPAFYRTVENRLKLKFDKRFKLFVLAASDSTCIIKYMHNKYYVNYDFKTHQYVGEKMQ